MQFSYTKERSRRALTAVAGVVTLVTLAACDSNETKFVYRSA